MHFESQVFKARDLLDRARKFVHRRSYWQSLAKSHPVIGLSLAQLDQRLAGKIGFPATETTLVPLPGLRFRRGRGYYNGHGIGPVTPALVDAYQALARGHAQDGAASLLAAGLAFQTAARKSHASWDFVLSPHEDDAALSLGGLIHQTSASTAQVLVCNAFTVCCWLGDGFRQSAMPAVSLLRSAEEKLSNQVLGSVSIGLDLWDAQVRSYYRQAVDNYPSREGFVFADDPHLRTPGEHDSIHRSILRIVETLRPNRVFFPLGLGSHLDHCHLRDVALVLSSEIRALGEPCSIYFYEDQPYATYDETDVSTSIASMHETGAFTAEVIDVTTSFEAKIQAVAAHRSQFRRDENEERLRRYASTLAQQAGLSEGRLAERIWRFDPH